MCLCRVKTLKKDINFMIYIDLFFWYKKKDLILCKMSKCCFVSQMNHKCIKKSVDVIEEKEKTIFTDGFFSINN